MTAATGRILLVVPSGTSFVTFLREAAEECRRRGATIAVATGPDLPGHAAPWPAAIERLDLPDIRSGSPLAVIRGARALGRHIRAWRPDVVHAHFTAAAVVAAATRLTMPRAGPAWIATFHGLQLAADPGQRSWRAVLAERWAARRMTQVWLLNREDRGPLAATVAESRIRVHGSCGVGCNLDVFDPARFPPAEQRSIRLQLGLPADAFAAAFVGRRTAFKGFDVAVRGFLAAVDAGLDGWLMLIGEPDAAHRSGLTVAEQRIVNGHPRILRLGWREDVAHCLAAADVMLLPSRREGMPVTAMEALAVGTPVITVDSRGCRDVVRAGIDGLVLPAAEPTAVAEALARCRTDADLLPRLRAAAIAGRSRFDRRRFSAEQADRYAEVLRTLDPVRGGHEP
jgi:glycosyltransferase involved in cell wall biosynthesis